jgi:hypothetical protein
MAGSLIKIDEEIVSGTPSTVQLLGIDSTYDVYMVNYVGVTPTTDDKNISIRFTVSGTADSSSNYDFAYKTLRTDTSFSNSFLTNQSSIGISFGIGSATGENANATFYLFNFNNASEYSFITTEPVYAVFNGNLSGHTGGAVLTVAQACDGVEFFLESSDTFEAGTFTLYGLKK